MHTCIAAPEVVSNIALVADQANAVVTLDWSNSFRFNGVLRYFIVIRNNITLIQSPITQFVFNSEPTGISKFLAMIVTVGVSPGNKQCIADGHDLGRVCDRIMHAVVLHVITIPKKKCYGYFCLGVTLYAERA